MAALSSREFNQYTGEAKKLAQKEPVFITERGSIEYVLLSITDYEKLLFPKQEKPKKNPFAVSEEEYFEFEILRPDWQVRGVDFE